MLQKQADMLCSKLIRRRVSEMPLFEGCKPAPKRSACTPGRLSVPDTGTSASLMYSVPERLQRFSPLPSPPTPLPLPRMMIPSKRD